MIPRSFDRLTCPRHTAMADREPVTGEASEVLGMKTRIHLVAAALVLAASTTSSPSSPRSMVQCTRETAGSPIMPARLHGGRVEQTMHT